MPARSPAGATRQHQGRRPAPMRRCCCSKTATACATRRSTSARARDLHEKQDFRATSLETLRQMVASGVGITLLPELAGPRRLRRTRAASPSSHSSKPVPTRTVGAVWRKSSARRAVILALCQTDRGHACERASGARSMPARSLDLRCADGRELAAHWFRGARSVAASSCSMAPRAFRRRSISSWLTTPPSAATTCCVYDYRGMGASAPADLASETTPHERLGTAGHARGPRRGRGSARKVCRWRPSDTASADNSWDC